VVRQEAQDHHQGVRDHREVQVVEDNQVTLFFNNNYE